MWHSVDLDVVALDVVDGLSPFLHASDSLLDHVTSNAQGDPAEASFESCHCLLHLVLVKGRAALDLRPQEEIQGIQVFKSCDDLGRQTDLMLTSSLAFSALRLF
jgi:hypothetical protein